MIRLSSLVRIIEDRAVAAAQHTKAHAPSYVARARAATARAMHAAASKVDAPKPKALPAAKAKAKRAPRKAK